MKLRNCLGCGRPVLELRGQFALLDSFYVVDDVPPLDSAGVWHARRLVESPYGEAWFSAKHRNFISVRRYEEVAALAGWNVLKNRNTGEKVAVERTGLTLSLSFSGRRPSKLSDGVVCTASEDFNLEFDDCAAIKRIQDSLSMYAGFPISALFEILNISDRVMHPEALEGSVLRYAEDMPASWEPDFVCGRAEYGVFVPAALEPFLSLKR